MQTKICKRCDEEKRLSEFSKRSRSKDGFNSWCRQCCAEYSKGYLSNPKNSEKAKRRSRKWNKDNRERKAATGKRYYEENKEEILDKQRAYYLENKKQVSKRAKEWRENNKEKENERKRKWREDNPERYRARLKRWRKANPDRVRELAVMSVERRRSRKASLPATLTPEQWSEILDQFNYRCAYCNRNGIELHQEHVIPIVQGGGYTADNIVPSCPRCNQIKGDRTPEQANMRIRERRKE